MRMAIVITVILVGIIAALTILGQQSEREQLRRDAGTEADTQEGTTPDLATAERVRIRPQPTNKDPEPGTGPAEPIDFRTVPRGVLEVVVVDANDEPLPTDDLRVHVASRGRSRPAATLPKRDTESHTWRFEREPEGPAVVTVRGDGIFDAKANVDVKPNATTSIRVRVKPAGTIHFHITDTDGNDLERATLTLYDANDKPVKAYFQERHALKMTSRKHTSSIALGYKGYITGLKAGRYTLRAEATNGFHASEIIDVEIGKVTEATVAVRQ